MVDCGSMCMPGAAEKVQELVDDAVRKGAQVGGWGDLLCSAKGAKVGVEMCLFAGVLACWCV